MALFVSVPKSVISYCRRPFSRGRLFGLLAVLVLAGPSQAAGVITFETTPSGATPTDNAPLSNSYTIDGVEIKFSVEIGDFEVPQLEDAVFEQIGVQSGEGDNGPVTGFTKTVSGESPVGDEAATGFESQLGDWFIRFGGGRTRDTLVIDYTSISNPISGASGEIWDIDARDGFPNPDANGAEQWVVRAYDEGYFNLLGEQTSPLGLDPDDIQVISLDAKPWVFKFADLNIDTGGIRHIVVSYIGTIQTDTVGLAFNNFSPILAVPEPATFSLLALAGTSVFFTRRRRMA